MRKTHTTITLMKHLYLLLIPFVLWSCGNERVLQLPEIKNTTITEVHDVSHAYLFYDETKEDSVDLNRKNIISTTNWLINVDKRLTLAQAIPKIKYLQDKKRNAKMHKNEAAKTYFTCHDTSIKNLSFLEFTDVNYTINDDEIYLKRLSKVDSTHIELHPHFFEQNQIKITIDKKNGKLDSKVMDLFEFQNYLKQIIEKSNSVRPEMHLNFSMKLSFQDYITFKSMISKLEPNSISIDTNEFIY